MENNLEALTIAALVIAVIGGAVIFVSCAIKRGIDAIDSSDDWRNHV